MKMINIKKKMGAFSLHIEQISIEKPGIYGLIGPNGCGKTTASKIIAGVLPFDYGEIDYEGLTERDITMLPQKPYLMRDTVYNNLVYPLKIRNIKPDDALCHQYLKKIGLEKQKKQSALSLSSGEAQKLALARAIIFKPKLMIIDEAVTDLDIESLCMAEQWLLDYQKSNAATMLVISHQLPHIQRICDYLFFMAGGGLVTEGNTRDMLFNPQDTLLRQYLKIETITTEVK